MKRYKYENERLKDDLKLLSANNLILQKHFNDYQDLSKQHQFDIEDITKEELGVCSSEELLSKQLKYLNTMAMKSCKD